jgi:hypothetical protein
VTGAGALAVRHPPGMTLQTDGGALDARITIEGPDDREPEDNEDFEPGFDWSLTCHQPDLSELVGSDGDTLETQRLIESHLSVDVNARLEWDSEGDMLWVCGAEADIRAVADAMQSMRQR